MRSLDCYRAVPVAENTPQFADKETYDAVVLVRSGRALTNGEGAKVINGEGTPKVIEHDAGSGLRRI